MSPKRDSTILEAWAPCAADKACGPPLQRETAKWRDKWRRWGGKRACWRQNSKLWNRIYHARMRNWKQSKKIYPVRCQTSRSGSSKLNKPSSSPRRKSARLKSITRHSWAIWNGNSARVKKTWQRRIGKSNSFKQTLKRQMKIRRRRKKKSKTCGLKSETRPRNWPKSERRWNKRRHEMRLRANCKKSESHRSTDLKDKWKGWR